VRKIEDEAKYLELVELLGFNNVDEALNAALEYYYGGVEDEGVEGLAALFE
jgi:hypothetical protein